jgi:hypothetical protein
VAPGPVAGGRFLVGVGAVAVAPGHGAAVLQGAVAAVPGQSLGVGGAVLEEEALVVTGTGDAALVVAQG